MKVAFAIMLVTILLLSCGDTTSPPEGPSGEIAWETLVLDTEWYIGVSAYDFNSDGSVEILAGTGVGFYLFSGSEWTESELVAGNTGSEPPQFDNCVYIDADGVPDVFFNEWVSGNIGWICGSTMETTIIATQSNPIDLTPSDVNEDGHLDVIVSSREEGAVYWYEAPNWQAHQIDAVSSWMYRCDVGDLDGDGHNDLVIPSGEVACYYKTVNSGEVSWSRVVLDSSGANDVAIADFNQDGLMDVGTESHSGTIAWLEQSSAGEWERHVLNGSCDYANRAVSGDMNQDGAPDLVSNGVWWDIYSGGTEHVISSGAPSRDVFPCDLDQDGDMDLAVAGNSGLYMYLQEESGE